MSAWRMPAETAPHERTWMAWPSAPYTLGATPGEAHQTWSAWAAVANAIIDTEPVSMLVTTQTMGEARRRLSAAVELIRADLDDAWYRDSGPTFVLDEHGRLGAVNWVFNGWGGQDWARWDADQYAAVVAIEDAEAVRIDSALVNEGGGIHTDGEGTFLVTETVQLDPGRNPGWSQQQVADELARTVGARTVIWLPRGLTRDSAAFGTRGHVDLVATFAAPGTVLVHDQRNPAHPDYDVCVQVRQALSAATDAEGRALELISLPAPRALHDAEGFVDYSYVNHYVGNKAVIVGTFDDPADAEACEILAAAYPGREVIAVDARAIFARGGGIHCITQQQPKSVRVS